MKKVISVLLILLIAMFTAKAQSQEQIIITPDYKPKLDMLNQEIFDAIINGRLKAYPADMKTAYSAEEAAGEARKEVVIQIYLDPTDPYYYIDSIALVPFSDQVIGYSVGFTKNEEIISIGFIRSPEMPAEGEEIPAPEVIFWIKWNDMRSVLKRGDLEFFKKFIEKN